MNSKSSSQNPDVDFLRDVQAERRRWVAYEKEQGKYNFWIGVACGLFAVAVLLGAIFLVSCLFTTHQ